jgi:hypothetical protein
MQQRARYLSISLFPLGFFLVLGVQTAEARGKEFYYMMVFGSQRIPCRARQAHTFATFVRATGEGTNPDNYSLTAHTISWMPKKLQVHCPSLWAEEGVNLSLERSLQLALGNQQRISMWGPYQIDRDLYDRSVEQWRLLQSGKVKYKAIDSGFPTNRVSNCIHAVSSLVEGYRLRVLSPSYGEVASYYVTCWLRSHIIDRNRRHFWVSSRLGLDAYPIIYRELKHPLSGPITGPIASWLLRRRDPMVGYPHKEIRK